MRTAAGCFPKTLKICVTCIPLTDWPYFSFQGRIASQMRRALLFLLLLLPALARSADHFNLARVIVTGSNRYKEDDLVRATGLIVNTQVSADDLQNAANRLGGSGAFATVQFLFKPAIGVKGVEADFQVADAEKFLPAVFENFVWFSESELQQKIHEAVPLYNGQLPTSGTMSDDVSAALTKFLASKQLPSEVSYMLAGEFGQPSSSYKFKIDNANLKIHDVTFTGATHVLPDELAKSAAPLKGSTYLRGDVAIVLDKNLMPLYRQHGYLKSAIAEIKTKAEDKETVSVEVAVNEGDQYRLAGYSWSGNTLVSSGDLSKQITVKTGEPVDALQLEKDLAKARKLFGKFGREGVVITPLAAFSDKSVAYTFTVKEGELYHMGKIEIEGIEPEAVQKLTQGWKLAEGAPYDSTYVQQFLGRVVLKVPGHKWTWMTFEQIDDTQKTVNVRLQVKIE
jgi:outer membrane protein assembly factor BamA